MPLHPAGPRRWLIESKGKPGDIREWRGQARGVVKKTRGAWGALEEVQGSTRPALRGGERLCVFVCLWVFLRFEKLTVCSAPPKGGTKGRTPGGTKGEHQAARREGRKKTFFYCCKTSRFALVVYPLACTAD